MTAAMSTPLGLYLTQCSPFLITPVSGPAAQTSHGSTQENVPGSFRKSSHEGAHPSPPEVDTRG